MTKNKAAVKVIATMGAGLNMTTKALEYALYDYLTSGTKKLGKYLCFEVKMPDSKERVDLIEYDKGDSVWRFYELKISKADFKSRAAHTFRGHYNYYVMPRKLYEEIQADIPDGVGVIVCNDLWKSCSSAKHAERQGLSVEHNKLMFNFMQALSRENNKFIKIKRAMREAGIV